MLIASLLVIVVAVSVAVVGSHRNLIATSFTVIAGCFGVSLAVGLICNAFAIPRHQWQEPIIFFAPLTVLGILATWAGQEGAIRLSDVGRVVNDISTQRRRRASIRADVRRRVNAFRVEVS